MFYLARCESVFVFIFYALLCVHSSFAIILKRKKKLAALLLLSYGFIITINVLWLFLAVPWVGLQYVTVLFTDHTHLLFVLFILLLTYMQVFMSVHRIVITDIMTEYHL